MLIFITNRNGCSEVLPRLKIRAKRYKPRTHMDLLRNAEPVYAQGMEVKGDTIRVMYKENKSVLRGEVVDGIGSFRGYEVSGSLPRIIQRTKVQSKTHTDIAIDDTAEVLTRILRHRGYQACDTLAELCKDGQQRIVVDTTLYWIENGVKLQVHVGSIRVKKVICTESTRLLPEYFAEYLPKQYRNTTFNVEELTETTYLRTRTDKAVDKSGYRYKFTKPVTNYGFMLNGDDLRDLREKVRLARLTANHKDIKL